MSRISLMTINMMLPVLGTYQYFHDLESVQDNYEELMVVVSEAGFEAVDVTSWETELLGIDFVKEILGRYGLSVSSYIAFGEFANPDSGFDDRVRQAREAADTAKALGTDILMLVPSAHEGISEMSPGEIRMTLVRHWIPAVQYAVSLGLCPVIEDTPDLRLCLDKAWEVKEVLDQVPGLMLVYDSGNMILDGEDPVEYVKEFAGRIGFVHLKDVRILPEDSPYAEHMRDGTPTAAAPTGTGLIDLAGVVKALLQTGYQGGMTVEFAKHEDRTYPESLKYSREYIEKLLKSI